MIGFDNEKYLRLQSEQIRGLLDRFGRKLYLEFGGKLFDDFHASRVLPGFAPDTKMKMLTQLRDQAEIIIAIRAEDIESNKIRGDLGITYDLDVLRLIDRFREFGLYVGSVVLTRYEGQVAAENFRHRLEALGVRTYLHYPILGYPSDVAKIASPEGYGKNDYIETERSLIVVTAPGPGSGKMATCLSQMYHDHLQGKSSGYAKFETFPVWNLPLSHPVNLAYEAATADLNDVNMIDPYHLEAYGEAAVNYNRDIEIFPVLKALFENILGTCPYASPTEMGVNMAGFCITDDEIVSRAARDEIIRRYYAAQCARRQGKMDTSQESKIEILMKQAGISPDDRPVVAAANYRAEETEGPAAAIELSDGSIVTGKTSSLLGASSAMLLNALKCLAGIPDGVHLISPEVIGPVQDLKTQYLGGKNPRLHTDEILVALSISAATNATARLAMEQLPKLSGCEVHTSVILSQVDDNIFRKLGVNLTSEPKYETQKLYHN